MSRTHAKRTWIIRIIKAEDRKIGELLERDYSSHRYDYLPQNYGWSVCLSYPWKMQQRVRKQNRSMVKNYLKEIRGYNHNTEDFQNINDAWDRLYAPTNSS